MRFGKFLAVVCLFLSLSLPSFAASKTYYDLQSKKGWSGYALLPPSWGICSGCSSGGDRLSWSWVPKVSSPSMDSIATKSVYGGGSTQWGDVLWNNHLIGSFSSVGLPDYSHTLTASLHSFTYDVYFWICEGGCCRKRLNSTSTSSLAASHSFGGTSAALPAVINGTFTTTSITNGFRLEFPAIQRAARGTT